MSTHEGGCLCGAVRFAAAGDPVRITYCTCRFCQRATGTRMFVEPIFPKSAVEIIQGKPKAYDFKSESSGMPMRLRFCETCATKVTLAFERFADFIGVYGGAFDDPNWFADLDIDRRVIFTDFAVSGTILPANLRCYAEHVAEVDGAKCDFVIHDAPFVIHRPRR